MRLVSGPGPAQPSRRELAGRDLLRARLFAVSYVPVMFIFGGMSETWLSRTGWCVAATIALVDGWRLTYGQLRKAEHAVVLLAVEDRGNNVSGYLATYLLPFIAGPPTGVGDALAYAVYFIVAMIVFIRSDLILVNPTLYLLGWRVAEGKHPRRGRVLLLCRRVPESGEQFGAVDLIDGLVRKS